MPKVTLEQWRMLKAVVEAGGFAKAAERVHKSPSSINHAVQKLQAQLGVALLEVRGRKAELTSAGEALLRRAGHLLDEAREMEHLARALATGVESEVTLAVDQMVPPLPVIQALDRFSSKFPSTRVQLHETVQDAGPALFQAGAVHVLLSPLVPAGFLAEPLGQIRLICVAHPSHSLNRAAGRRSLRDLRPLRQVVVRATGTADGGDADWLEAEQRWTVGHVTTALDIVEAGLAFAWLPECLVREALDRGSLVAVELEAGATKVVPFSLTCSEQGRAGTAARALGETLRTAFEPVVGPPPQEELPDWWSMAQCGPRARL